MLFGNDMHTPILLITFNRPVHTRRTLQQILNAHPCDLYIFQDGPREGSSNLIGEENTPHPDVEKCADVRSVINELTTSYAVNHADFHLYTFYSNKNLGCGSGPMTGISWFFDNVEQGIVMEDDCFANPDFFPYCEELLNRYKGTEVKFINSTLYDNRWHDALVNTPCPMRQRNALDGRSESRWPGKGLYGFSRYMVTGAWASYREVWQGFDLDLKEMNALKFSWHVYRLTHNLAEAEWWWYQVRAIQQDESKKSYWDYQMQIHLFRQNALTIHPVVNLISNIGFDAEGTHTIANNGDGNRPTYPIMPLLHPDKLIVDANRDMFCWAKKQSKGLLKDLLFVLYHIYAWRNRKLF